VISSAGGTGQGGSGGSGPCRFARAVHHGARHYAAGNVCPPFGSHTESRWCRMSMGAGRGGAVRRNSQLVGVGSNGAHQLPFSFKQALFRSSNVGQLLDTLLLLEKGSGLSSLIVLDRDSEHSFQLAMLVSFAGVRQSLPLIPPLCFAFVFAALLTTEHFALPVATSHNAILQFSTRLLEFCFILHASGEKASIPLRRNSSAARARGH